MCVLFIQCGEFIYHDCKSNVKLFFHCEVEIKVMERSAVFLAADKSTYKRLKLQPLLVIRHRVCSAKGGRLSGLSFELNSDYIR